jgi:hypothetical protein
MDNSSTLKDNKTGSKKELKASKKTIDFLQMFARAYYVEKALPVSMGSICLN